MYRKLIALFALFAVLSSVALAQDFSANIKLKLYEDSSKHWLAVNPLSDDAATIRVEMMEATSNDWVEMNHVPEWGYFQMWSTSPSGFALPVSFRLTSDDGEQVILDNVMTSVAAGEELETAVRFARSARHNGNGHNGNGGRGDSESESESEDNSEDSNGGGRPDWCPTARPTRPPTSAPTTAPADPTSAPADPTTAPTTRPTQRPTQTPTERPTQRPTQTPTERPTQRPSSSGSSSPTTRPTSAPTTRPTQRPSSSGASTPTSAPTTRPSTSGSSSGSSSTDLCAVTPTSQEPVKILVPLYQEPGKDWDSLITSANAGTTIIAIINPDNGPVNNGPPSNWVTYMNKMKAANIDMIGYVATGYAANSISTMKSQIDTYANKYTGLKGIFLDEVSNLQKDIAYYQELYDYIMAKSGYIHDILNPGTSTIQGYMAASTSIVIYESGAGSYKNPSASWIKCAPSASEKAGYKYRFSGIAFGASQSQMSTIIAEMSSAGIGMVYLTDKNLPNPYDPIPSYWSAFATAVKNL